MNSFVFPQDFGALADGLSDDTAAVQAAMDLAAETGGICFLQGGTFVCGTLFLPGGLTLEIAAGATLQASPRIADYAVNTHHNRYRNEPELDRCFLYAADAAHITLRGAGVIDGSAAAFPNAGSIDRPMLLRTLRCHHLRLQGLRLYNAAAWTTAFLDSSFLWAEDLDICNETNYNGDGLDFDGCHHVFVRGCRIRGTDDNLCLQSSGRPVYAVHISDCSFSSICAGIRIGLKSIGSISDVVIQNCTMREVWREGIKLECTEGGRITDISVYNVIMHNVRRPIFAILNNRFAPEGLGSSKELKSVPAIGQMQRLRFCGITAVDDETMQNVHTRFGNDVMGSPAFNGIRFDAPPGHPIRDVVIDGLHYTAVGGVRRCDLPAQYPTVLDRRQDPHSPSSENYWPDWSRAAFADIRNVENLRLYNLHFAALYEDDRPPLLTEGCTRGGTRPEDAGK